jgi:hypothetical protein
MKYCEPDPTPEDAIRLFIKNAGPMSRGWAFRHLVDIQGCTASRADAAIDNQISNGHLMLMDGLLSVPGQKDPFEVPPFPIVPVIVLGAVAICMFLAPIIFFLYLARTK